MIGKRGKRMADERGAASTILKAWLNTMFVLALYALRLLGKHSSTERNDHVIVHLLSNNRV